MKQPVCMVVATNSKLGIGVNGQVPWRLAEDMKWFRTITSGQVVIMGRKTWDSIPRRFRPLSNRINVVVSRTLKAGEYTENEHRYHVVNTVPDAFVVAQERAPNTSACVVGGAQIYAEALPRVDRIYVTWVERDKTECDTFVVPWTDDFVLHKQLGQGLDGLHAYRRELWTRKPVSLPHP